MPEPSERSVSYWIKFLEKDPIGGDRKAAALLMQDLCDYGYPSEIHSVLNLITAVRTTEEKKR